LDEEAPSNPPQCLSGSWGNARTFWPPGATTLVIGGILALSAAYLAYECKGLLTGESASRVVVSEIERIIAEDSDIYRLNELLTMHFGPHDILLNVSLNFADRLSSTEVENNVSSLEQRIKKRFPDVKRIFIEAQHSSALTNHAPPMGKGSRPIRKHREKNS